jgi:hypothetical protein
MPEAQPDHGKQLGLHHFFEAHPAMKFCVTIEDLTRRDGLQKNVNLSLTKKEEALCVSSRLWRELLLD